MEEKGRIGIPKALMFYRYFPLWRTFFEELGWKVLVSDGVRPKEKIVYFEDSCLPMKLLVTHAMQLKGRVDHLFIPRLVSIHPAYIMCPKFRGAPDIVRLASGRSLSVIDEIIDLRKGGASLLRAFQNIGKRLGASAKESKKAFQNAEQVFSRFQKEWVDRINRLPSRKLFEMEVPTPEPCEVQGSGHESNKVQSSTSSIEAGEEASGSSLRIALIGHPYNLFDIDINKDLPALAKHLGMEIVTSDLLSEKEIDREISGFSKDIYWSSGREIVGSLFHFLSHGADGVIFVTSFKCGIDALLQEFIKRRLKLRGESSVPLLILSFDEHTGREGLTTRLEAFRDVVEEHKRSQGREDEPKEYPLPVCTPRLLRPSPLWDEKS